MRSWARVFGLKRILLCALALVAFVSGASASDDLQYSGFALLRGAAGTTDAPFFSDHFTSQVQLGIDWRPSPWLGAHVHLLARNDADGSRRGIAGIPEAYVEAKFHRGDHRLRVVGGAFFLPTSRENVDALWESPYTITPSALNSWFGEEFRPIGIDLGYTYCGSLTGGVTVFRGNDTFGALPAVRGWSLRDHWALLGEHLPVDGTYFTSVSAETDHQLGWAARGRWSNDHALVQLTHIDNRSDAIEHGELLNWYTDFDIAAAEYSTSDWTFAGETGWGNTTVIFDGIGYRNPLRASYVLVSKRISTVRASLRAEAFSNALSHRRAVTAALFWSPPGTRLRTGIEAITLGGQKRVSLEMRYSFAK